MTAAKPAVEAAHQKLLAERYDLSGQTFRHREDVARQASADRRAREAEAKVSRGNRSLLLRPIRWKQRDVYPAGFLPLPHPNHPEGGMLFPKSHINLRESAGIARSHAF